ncbi:MAG: TatD family hydrolase [Clostridia bacterium]|nr:TatD family hydrolase [Clostridia bacterium]
MIFDTHAHYTDEQFDSDRDELLESMPENNIGLIMNACSSLDEMPDILALAEKYPYIYAAVGIHPEAVLTADDGYLDNIREYTKHHKVKAIGEIGLDYHWTTETKSEQKRILGEQIDLARELNMPVIIHDREAHADTLAILKEHNVYECGGVFHCYSGSAEMVREITDMGMYIAFGGTVTFKNANKPREAAKAVPLDRLLIETDSPYLAPTPYRGKRNSSLYLPEVINMLSELHGITPDEIERITAENGKRLFNITE